VLVLVAGKDPVAAVGGHQSYVRAHALAAAAAGFEPHVFCVTTGKAETVDTDFGVLHRVTSPVRPVRHPMAPLHAPYLAAAIGRYLGAPRRGGRELVHGFGPWGYVAATVAAARRRRGGDAMAVSSAYTTLEHDWRGKLAGLGWQHGVGKRLRYEIEMLWIRAWAARCERRGYDGSRLVLVNY
jgi:hypothetical protein